MLREPVRLRLPRKNNNKKKEQRPPKKKFKGEKLRSPHSKNNNKKNWARKPATKKKTLVARVNKLTVNKCGRTARAALEKEGPMVCAAALPGGSWEKMSAAKRRVMSVYSLVLLSLLFVWFRRITSITPKRNKIINKVLTVTKKNGKAGAFNTSKQSGHQRTPPPLNVVVDTPANL